MDRNHTGQRYPMLGFTILEVVVALAVSGVVLLGARLMFDTLASAARDTIQAGHDADQSANGERLLRSLAGRLEIGTGHSTHFGGDERSVHFTTWCDTPSGWLEHCNLVLSVEPVDSKPALVAHLTAVEAHGDLGSHTIVLATGFRSGALRYLNDPRTGGHWFIRWGEAVSAPLALGVILDGDTSIVRIGERE